MSKYQHISTVNLIIGGDFLSSLLL